jgi:hypothetical protein
MFISVLSLVQSTLFLRYVCAYFIYFIVSSRFYLPVTTLLGPSLWEREGLATFLHYSCLSYICLYMCARARMRVCVYLCIPPLTYSFRFDRLCSFLKIEFSWMWRSRDMIYIAIYIDLGLLSSVE